MRRRSTFRSFAPADRLSAIAPLPFVATTAVLVLLVLFTPVLLSTGPSPILAQGQLTIDRLPSGNWTKFYVMALDPHAIRYASIALAVGTGFAWNGSCPTSVQSWSSAQENETLGLGTSTGSDPVVVNATAVYQASTGPVVYAGEYAFHVLDGPGSVPQLLMVPCTATTPGASVPSSAVAIASLPVTIQLVNYGSGGVP